VAIGSGSGKIPVDSGAPVDVPVISSVPALTSFYTASVYRDNPDGNVAPLYITNDAFNSGGTFAVRTRLTDPNKEGGTYYFDLGPAGKTERTIVNTTATANVSWAFSPVTIPLGTPSGTYAFTAYFVDKKGAKSNTITATVKITDKGMVPELTWFFTATFTAGSPPTYTKHDTFNAGGQFGVQTQGNEYTKEGGTYYFDLGPAGKSEKTVSGGSSTTMGWSFSPFTIPAGTAPGTYTCSAYFVDKKGVKSNTLPGTYKVE
jgi:hypothetical protein